MSHNSETPLLAKIINGSIAGMIGISSVFPIDLIKTRLQNQPIGPNGEKLYTSMLDCFKKVYGAEGWRGLYRGMIVTVALATPEKTIKLATNDVMRTYLQKDNEKLTIPKQLMAGGTAGVFQIFVSAPLELLKINLQIAALQKDNNTGPKLTARALFRELMREKGIFGVYKGLGSTAIRDITFSSTFFTLFATLADLGPHNPDGSSPSWCSLLAGLTAGSFSAVLVTPIDVVKTRIQASLKQVDGKTSCIGIIECIQKVYRNEGPMAFFKGGLCRVMVFAPLLGIAQVVYYLGVGQRIVKFFSQGV